jgi:surfactin synthase thioesterase subunit
MFDYNLINNETDEVTVEPYSKQSELLNAELNSIYKSDTDAEITLICHSQGCIIPCLIKDIKIERAVLLAPPKILGSNMRRNKNAVKTEQGEFRIPRKDGTTTIVTKEFVEELDKTFPLELYSNLSNSTNSFAVIAKQDEIIRDTDLSALADKIKIYEIDGDHNFTGKNRKGLMETLSKILN